MAKQLYRYATDDEIAGLLRGPSQQQTQLYNALGRNAGMANNGDSDNFFVKRGKSIENALGTTGAAIVSGVNDAITNTNRDKMRKNQKEKMNDIAKKYGYNTYQDVWDARDAAEASGDKATIEKIDNVINPELSAMASENKKEMDKFAADYKDYTQNDYISKKINQDPGKFAGSAINTLSTAADIALPAAGVAFNTVQGGVEGIADELEQNGIQNFDWGRAGQNALVGATTGAVVGGLNKGINSALAKRGGNLLKGGNKLTKAINNFNTNNALGQVASTVGTGAARGALSGTVGGATGAGLSAALNGQDVLASAVEGARRGATQGALAGGVMSGANLALNKTPGVGKVMQNLNEAGENWKQSGDNFNERLTNTLTSGDSAVGEWLQGNRQSRLLGSAGNVGNSINDISATPRRVTTNQIAETLDENGAVFVPKKAAERFLRQNKKYAQDYKNDFYDETQPELYDNMLRTYDEDLAALKNMDDDYVYLENNPMSENEIRVLPRNQLANDKAYSDVTLLGNETPTTLGGWLKQAGQRVVEDANNRGVGMSIKNVAATDPWDRLAQENGYNNYDEVIDSFMKANPDVQINPNGMAGQVLTWLDQNSNTPQTAGDWLKRAGQRVAEDVNNRGVGLGIKDVSEETPADIRNMQINRNDMLGYADDNSEPMTVEQALSQAGITNRLNTAQIEQPEAILTKQNNTVAAQDTEAIKPETQLYNQLNNKTSREAQLRNAAGLKLQQQYGTIDKPTAKATNAPETLQKIKNAGFIKPADVERMADVITGSNGEVSKLVSNLVQTAKPINTFDGETQGQTLKDYIDLAVQKRGLNGINEGKAVKSQIDALMKSLPSHADGSITFEDNPQDVFKLTQMLDSEAAQYEGRSGMNYGTTTPDKLRAAQVIKDVSNLLKDRVYSTVDVKKALTPDVAENLKSYAPNNKEFADYVDNTIMKAQNVADLRSAQAPWVRAKKIIDNGYMNSITYGGRMGNSTTIPATKRGLTTAALNATINSGPGLRAQSKILDKAADWVAKRDGGSNNTTALVAATDTPMAANNTPATQIYNMIGRTEGNLQNEQARSAEYLANAAQEGEIVQNDNNMQVPDTSTSLYDQFYGTGANAANATLANNTTSNKAGYFDKTGDYWTDLLANAMSSAIDADDVTAFAALYGMYQDALSSKAKSNEKDYSDVTNWNSADRSKLLDAQNSLGQIDLLESAYNNATGGEGGNAIQGNLRNVAANILGGNLDPSANNYNKQAESIGMGIVKNMINLGVTEADAKRYLEYLPALTDTKEQAAQKLATLRAAYQNQINNLYASYGL